MQDWVAVQRSFDEKPPSGFAVWRGNILDDSRVMCLYAAYSGIDGRLTTPSVVTNNLQNVLCTNLTALWGLTVKWIHNQWMVPFGDLMEKCRRSPKV